MNPFHALTRPYYVHRPAQLLRRLQYHFLHGEKARAHWRWIDLPWGFRLRITAADDLGQSILTTGVNDLTITESLFRMASPGELTVDVGANVGYTSSVLAAAVGDAGQVISFEPHPAIFAELIAHIADWEKQGATSAGRVVAVNAAVSASAGCGLLIEPEAFSANRGRSQLREDGSDSTSSAGKIAPATGRAINTKTVTLDDELERAAPVGVLKVDVEGHEEQVFAGAQRLLSSRRVRDIAFEEFDPFPAKTHLMLQEHGYGIFVVEERLSGPRLIAADPNWRAPQYSPPNYVATLDPNRLTARFSQRGWVCLRRLRGSEKGVAL